MEEELLLLTQQILTVLEKADSYCPLEYISLYTNLDQLSLNILLKKLENDGYVYRRAPNDWSTSGYPQFKLNPKTSIKHLNKEPLEKFAR